MSSVKEIEEAVSGLTPEELLAFREWFARFDADVWDQQFDRDAESGHLNLFADEALAELSEGRTTAI